MIPLCACAAVLGIDDGHPRAGGEDGGADGASDAAAADGAVTTPTTLPDGAPIPTGCENVALDPTTGVFVATTGADSPGCGTEASPCLTIQNGINLAHDATSTPNVYVASGAYSEALTLKSGVNVLGGWSVSSSGVWGRDSSCSNQDTTLTAPAGQNIAVSATGFPAGSPSKLSTLSIVSGDPALQPGESLFGIVATGATTVLNLVWVNVTAGPGGAGTPGTAGSAGTAPTGVCGSAGDAGAGTTPGGKGIGADAGWFASSGYVASSAAPGNAGSGGANGEPGGDAGCVTCVTCSGATCTASTVGSNCGTPGEPGCGGGGGQGGIPGGSGGSSVAVLAIDARVVLESCVLTAGAAGGGGAGGPGGAGAAGIGGSAGAANPTSCAVKCTGLGVTGCGSTEGAGTGGSAGGIGGTGATGGPGGDGAGGDSFAVVQLGNAALGLGDAGAVFVFGAPGAGPDGGNGAPGRAGAQGP